LHRERDDSELRLRRANEDLDIARGQAKVLGKEVELLAHLHELSLARVQAATATAAMDGAIPAALNRKPAEPAPGSTLTPWAAR
jgi:hypothetical protein